MAKVRVGHLQACGLNVLVHLALLLRPISSTCLAE